MSQILENVYYDAVILENASTKEEVIQYLSGYLMQKGYVNQEYLKATLEREDSCPTGLPTKPVGIAVPHSKAENVIRPAVIMGIAKKLIPFAEMGNSKSVIAVGIIFLLALQGENRHLNYLKNIVNFCKQEDKLMTLYKVTSREEAYRIFHSEILCLPGDGNQP
ncbi:phosphotransferase/anion transporter [Lucifera butyrica]|uniref:Phosphotransferase/anion transporter n=1 Tax=Lucifera butyrica TaxID=1351585 RepID=A0A498RDI8_9FIRM|nr:PTS sugar transporter subunit IIA [Lucifera butyrica]VBB07268.1 phosphotransferase/anion transporter [Lucifera butyrica]